MNDVTLVSLTPQQAGRQHETSRQATRHEKSKSSEKLAYMKKQ